MADSELKEQEGSKAQAQMTWKGLGGVGKSLIANSFACYIATCHGDRYTCDFGMDLKRMLALPTLQKSADRSLYAKVAVHPLCDACRV